MLSLSPFDWSTADFHRGDTLLPIGELDLFAKGLYSVKRRGLSPQGTVLRTSFLSREETRLCKEANCV
jgi:hypothetical protein